MPSELAEALRALLAPPAGGAWLLAAAAAALLLALVAAVAAIRLAGRLRAAEARLEAGRSAEALLDASRQGLADSFRALAADALHRNAESFLTLAAERFRTLRHDASAELGSRQQAVEALVAPLRDAIDSYRSEAQTAEARRVADAGRAEEQIRSLALETTKLANALRSPNARGRWGELTLRRTAELAGLSSHCDFAEQVTLRSTNGSARPDMIVRLPARREIAVDAKVPLTAYLEAVEAGEPAEREAAIARHASNVRRHVDGLASRGYARSCARAPEFVVLFLPNEAFLGAAVDVDRGLVEYALGKGVVLATPSTFYALLQAVAQGWRHERVAEGAQRILDLAQEMDDRLRTFTEHLARMGTSLGRSVDAYNAAVGSFDLRVLPQSRRLRELGLVGRAEPAELAPLDARPRTPQDGQVRG